MSIFHKLKKLFTKKDILSKPKQQKLALDITVESSTVISESEPNVVISPIPANVIVDIQTAIILDYYRGRKLDIYQPFYLKEIAGYRDVLALVNENFEYMPLKTSIILQLHRDLYKYEDISIGGKYKNSDNQIIETD